MAERDDQRSTKRPSGGGSVDPMSVPGVTAATIVLIVAVVSAVAWWLVDPAPPSKITIATGPEGGFYRRLGQRFAWGLERFGVEVNLVTTSGTGDNLDLINEEGSVDVAFVQGGVGAAPPEDTILRALGTMSIEPLWIFSRSDEELTDFLERDTIRLAADREGSGTRDLVDRLVQFVGILDRVEFVEIAGEEAAQALLEGEVDVATFVTAPTTPWVDRLLRDPSVKLVETENFDAIARRLPFVMRIDIPQRAIDFASNIPSEDKSIFGVSTGLIVREDLHPAIKQLLLQVSETVATGDRLLGTSETFPTRDHTEYPIDSEAERYFEYGPTLMRRYFPFWAANLLERFWVLIIPIATLLIPIVRFGPSTVQWGFRRRIFRHYRELRDIEASGLEAESPQAREIAMERLRSIDAQLQALIVPLPYRDELYRLRMQVDFVRDRLINASGTAMPAQMADADPSAAAQDADPPVETASAPDAADGDDAEDEAPRERRVRST